MGCAILNLTSLLFGIPALLYAVWMSEIAIFYNTCGHSCLFWQSNVKIYQILCLANLRKSILDSVVFKYISLSIFIYLFLMFYMTTVKIYCVQIICLLTSEAHTATNFTSIT